MSISSILGGSVAGVSSAAGGATKSSSNAFAEIFARARGAISSETNSATTGATVAEQTREAEIKLSEFKRAMQQVLETAGIDSTWDIRLQSDGNGGVQVSPSHPECDKIEQILRENPDLIEKFKTLQEAFGRLRSGSGNEGSDAAQTSVFSVVFADDAAHVEFE